MRKVAALEEMYLIYQQLRSRLAGPSAPDDNEFDDLTLAFQSFCQREPIGGMFLEAVLEELIAKFDEVETDFWVTD